LRGGILDVFPLSSPWPARLEFFGDELESLRSFDPITQISKESVESINIPPAGEFGILKRQLARNVAGSDEPASDAETQSPLATLVDYLPPETIFLLCEPEALGQAAEDYEQRIPSRDPFFVAWKELRAQMIAREMIVLEVTELEERSAPAQVEAGENHGLTVSDPPLNLSASKPGRIPPGWRPGRLIRGLPRRNGVSFLPSSTAGCGKAAPSIFFATTTASGGASRKYGRSMESAGRMPTPLLRAPANSDRLCTLAL